MADPIIDISKNETEGKAYATISSKGGWPTVEDVLSAAKTADISLWINESAIRRAIEKHLFDKPFEVASAKDGRVLITVEKGDREAFMVIEPAYGGREMGFEDVEEALAERSVVFGVDEAAVREALWAGNYGNRVRVAVAKEAVNGRNATIEYLFRTEWVLKPKDLNDNTIDYKNLDSVASVGKNTTLARKIPATRGEDGMTVTGKPIRALHGKDVRLSPGKNTSLSEDGLELTSDIDGQPVKMDRVSVEPIITIDGDIDYSTGNIDFVGSVIVLGSVISGFSVRASANIQINGVVEDSYIEAGGDVLVRGGIHSRGGMTVKAGGSVSALFIEQASIEAGATIVAQEVLHSDLVAGDRVIVTSGKGRISGGRIKALNVIDAKVVGADSYVKTELTVGFDPKQKAKLEGLKRDRTRQDGVLSEVQIGIATLERYRAAGSPLWQRHEERYRKLLETEQQLRAGVEKLAYEIGVMEERITRAENARVKIAQTIYPNVIIRVKNLRFENETELAATGFYEEEGEIKATTYVL